MIKYFFATVAILFSSLANSEQPSSDCSRSYSKECVLSLAEALFYEIEYQSETDIAGARLIGISAALNISLDPDIHSAVSIDQLDTIDSFYLSGKALSFGISEKPTLWHHYVNKVKSPTAVQWALAYFVRHQALSTRSKNIALEKMLQNAMQDMTVTHDAHAYYAINSNQIELINTQTSDLIQSDMEDDIILKTLFSYIAIAIIKNEIAVAKQVYLKARNYFDSSRFWHSFDSATKALLTASKGAVFNKDMDMIEDSPFKATVYTYLLDLLLSNGQASKANTIGIESLYHIRNVAIELNPYIACMIATKMAGLSFAI